MDDVVEVMNNTWRAKCTELDNVRDENATLKRRLEEQEAEHNAVVHSNTLLEKQCREWSDSANDVKRLRQERDNWRNAAHMAGKLIKTAGFSDADPNNITQEAIESLRKERTFFRSHNLEDVIRSLAELKQRKKDDYKNCILASVYPGLSPRDIIEVAWEGYYSVCVVCSERDVCFPTRIKVRLLWKAGSEARYAAVEPIQDNIVKVSPKEFDTVLQRLRRAENMARLWKDTAPSMQYQDFETQYMQYVETELMTRYPETRGRYVYVCWWWSRFRCLCAHLVVLSEPCVSIAGSRWQTSIT